MLVYIVATVVVSILSLSLLILLSLLLIFILVLLLFLLSHLHYLFIYLFIYFNLTVVGTILAVFITKVKPCTTCTLNDLVPCSIEIEPYPIFKAKFVQRDIVN